MLGLATGGLVSLRYDFQAATLVGARRLLDEALHRWNIHSLSSDVSIIATELVTNGIQHALRGSAEHGWLTVALKGDSVICAVTDPSPTPPTPRSPLPGEESGYGLQIVSRLSASWGHSVVDGSGKVVWARVPLTASDPDCH
ncbi:ATP-binding protein [Streptomyces lydicus]